MISVNDSDTTYAIYNNNLPALGVTFLKISLFTRPRPYTNLGIRETVAVNIPKPNFKQA